jgi:hypothetical protein
MTCARRLLARAAIHHKYCHSVSLNGVKDLSHADLLRCLSSVTFASMARSLASLGMTIRTLITFERAGYRRPAKTGHRVFGIQLDNTALAPYAFYPAGEFVRASAKLSSSDPQSFFRGCPHLNPLPKGEGKKRGFRICPWVPRARVISHAIRNAI